MAAVVTIAFRGLADTEDMWSCLDEKTDTFQRRDLRGEA